jgi:hypothetical protein
VNASFRKAVATEHEKVDESLAVQRRLAAREADHLCVTREEANEFERLFEVPIILSRLRRLGAHEAVVVAALSQKDAVLMARGAP